MEYSLTSLNELTEQFASLPGIGRKSAQRLAFYMLSAPEEKARNFAAALVEARQKIGLCPECQSFSEGGLCPVCKDVTRDESVICVVCSPADVLSIERTHEFRGKYHVLHGCISPLDSVGPDDIKVRELIARLGSGKVKEVILATDPTVDGDVTATYISRLVAPLGVTATRLAYGVPMGGRLEYADEFTLSRALDGRTKL